MPTKEDRAAYKRQWYLANREITLERARKHYEENKDAIALKMQLRYKENLEDFRAYKNRYDAENRELVNEKAKQRRLKNPGHVKSLEAANRVKNYHKPSNVSRRRENVAKRRATKLNATPCWLTQDQKSAIQAMYSLAKDCEIVTGERYEVDHIVPLISKVVCGLHVPWNLQILPYDLNRKKSNGL